jgi:glutamine---fructose-6-phosphate transaminase (isomerizing)
VIVNGQTSLYEKNISSVQEIKARKGKVIGVIASSDKKKDIYDATMEFDSLHPDIDPILEVVILQLFSYFVALYLGREIDKPRNLAKAVTVE